MKKIISLVLCAVFLCFCIFATYKATSATFVYYDSMKLTEGQPGYEVIKIRFVNNIYYSISLFGSCIFLVIFFINIIKTDHAIRYTYEEYKTKMDAKKAEIKEKKLQRKKERLRKELEEMEKAE